MTRTCGSASASCSAAMISPRRPWFSALRFSGRLRVILRTCGAGSSVRTNWYGMALFLSADSIDQPVQLAADSRGEEAAPSARGRVGKRVRPLRQDRREELRVLAVQRVAHRRKRAVLDGAARGSDEL